MSRYHPIHSAVKRAAYVGGGGVVGGLADSLHTEIPLLLQHGLSASDLSAVSHSFLEGFWIGALVVASGGALYLIHRNPHVVSNVLSFWRGLTMYVDYGAASRSVAHETL